MTRWKREFKAWAERERLCVVYTPKRPEDFKTAQALSLTADHCVGTIVRDISRVLGK